MSNEKEEIKEKTYIFADQLIENKYPILKKLGYKTKLKFDEVVITRPSRTELKIPDKKELKKIFDTCINGNIDLFLIMQFLNSGVTGRATRDEIEDFFCLNFKQMKTVILEQRLTFIVDAILVKCIVNELMFFDGTHYYLSDIGRFFVRSITVSEKNHG